MSQPVTVSEAQDQLLETAFDLYRIRQRLHHQFKGLKAEYESVREYYDSDEEPSNKEPRPLELEVAEESTKPSISSKTWPMTSGKRRVSPTPRSG